MTTDTRTQHTHWGIGAEMLTPAGTVEIHSDEGDVIGFVFPQYAEKVAAAPDLLAALDAARQALDPGSTWPSPARKQLLAEIDAAIAKARGQ